MHTDHCVVPLFFFCVCLNATLRGHRTELNQTLPHVCKWARFENGCPKFWGSLPCNMGPKPAYLWVVLWRHYDLSTSVFRTKCAIGDGKNLKLQRVSYLPLKFGELWPTNRWDYVAHFTHRCNFHRHAGQPSHHNCPSLLCLASCLVYSYAHSHFNSITKDKWWSPAGVQGNVWKLTVQYFCRTDAVYDT